MIFRPGPVLVSCIAALHLGLLSAGARPRARALAAMHRQGAVLAAALLATLVALGALGPHFVPAGQETLWGLVALSTVAAVGGATFSARNGALAVRPCLWATTLLGSACAWLLWLGSTGALPLGATLRAIVGGMPLAWTLPGARLLAFAVPCCWLGATFAGSLQQLSAGEQGFRSVPLAWTIARRLLLSRGAQVVSTVSRIAVLGVTLGVWLVLVSMGILSGFEHDLTAKIMGSSAHLTLVRTDAQPILLTPQASEPLAPAQLVGAAAMAPFIETELAAASGSNYAGAQLLGIDVGGAEGQGGAEAVLGLLQQLTPAQKRALMGPCAPHCPLVLGAELARNLGVGPGDRIRLISPVGEVLTPVGPVPRSMGGRIVGVLQSKMYETDSRLVLSSVGVAQRLLGWQPQQVSGLQLAAMVPEEVATLAKRAQAALARSLQVPTTELLPITWQSRNLTLFAALELERVVAAVVLAFIILVASFSIVNTLSMSIRQRRHEIAILKAMGAPDATVLQIFLGQGMLIGGIGTLVGAGLGTATLWMLRRWGFGIPYEVYYIDALPVDIAGADVVGVVASALLILWNFAVVPSSQAAALRPAEGLRDG